MQYPRYKLSSSVELETFEFTSTGPKGNIEKQIQFEMTDDPFVYNLAFGDKIEVMKDGQLIPDIDDKVISDNGDRDIVLATVAEAAYEYTSKYPERWVILVGRDDARKRLYRRAITINYTELCKDYFIFGFNIVKGKRVMFPFSSNDQFYGFIITKK